MRKTYLPLSDENDKALKKEYPYYCSFCDENKYEFECMGVEKKEKRRH